MIKPLIIGTSYIGSDGAQCYTSRVVELWAKLAIHLNPGVDILLIDSASPTNPVSVLGNLGFGHTVDDNKKGAFDFGGRGIVSFTDNVGHLNTTGRDGFGRAFCYGVEIAFVNSYTHVAYMDSDIISTQPVMPIIEKMFNTGDIYGNNGVKVACPLDTTYLFIENGLMFYNVGYMVKSRFVERYDWPNRKRDNNPQNIPEVVFEKLLADDLFLLPMRGLRDDFNRLTVNNISTSFPYGLDFITHVRDYNVYLRFLEWKGIKL